MTHSDIITNQFVRINQTHASIGERIFARIIDYIIIDVGFSGIGILFILLTKDSQRLGDLAAGTIVVKEIDIDKIHVSLDEFYYAKKDYHPVYEEAKNLSQAQIEVIEKAVYSNNDKHEEQIEKLANKVARFLHIEEKLKESLQKGNSKEKFLATILHDYNYYLMELI